MKISSEEPMTNGELTHIDEKGNARMVDVSAKSPTLREAVARSRVLMNPATLALIEDRKIPKGDVYSVARIAGIMAAKKTSDIIPMCHPLEITGIDISFNSSTVRGEIDIDAKIRTWGRTGVEMEAMVAVSAAALTIYDMCKAVDRAMTLTDIRLIAKHGGKSGDFVRET
ncbi:MAG: cyclic pyranopterin monophosphate synthase MoaC [Syntrophales bacterium]|nr:cyclic pyranopterin monophosphate synthase MoaC [Syntrophales bacterium]